MRFNELAPFLKVKIDDIKPIENELSFEQYMSANKPEINHGLTFGAYYQGDGLGVVDLTPRQYRLYITAKLRALFPSVSAENIIKALN